MSTIDERVVILEFNNSQFESGVQQSVSTLQKLKSALNLDDSANSLNKLSSAGKSFSLSHVADNVQTVADRFSMLGIVGDQVLRRLTDSALKLGKNLITAVPNQIISGGKRRSQNLEHAKFMLEGILQDAYDWTKINEDLDYAVGGTRFGLDEAASAAGQLAASSVQFGDDMKAALRGISGVATMTNDEYSTISQIFTKIAGQGKVTAQELNQFAAHGINVAATMAKEFDVTEGEIRELVHEGQVGFLDFAYAMDSAFGEHAKRANDTFTGALANVKAALSRMGEQFATPVYDNLRLILVALIPVLNDIKAFTEPIAAGFKGMAEAISGFVVPALEGLHVKFAEMRGLVTDYADFETVFTKWADTLTGKTPEEIEQLGLLNQAFEEIDKTYNDYKENLGKSFDKTIATQEMEMAMNVLAGVVENTEAGVKVTFDEILAGMNDSGEAAKKTVRDVFTELLNVKTNSKGILDDIKKTTESLDKDTEKIKDTYKSSTKESKKFTSWQSLVFDSAKAAYKGLKEYGVEGLALNKAMRQEAEAAAKQKADKERVKDLKTINANEKSYVKTLARETEQSKKQSAIEKFKNGVFQKASGLVSGIAKGAADVFGFNQETVAVLADQKDYLQVVDDLAQKGIHGEFGNGEERVKALEDLGAAYSIVQNRINEVLGCEVRHTETAEDEAKMMEYVCKTLGISAEQGKNITTVLDNLTGIFEGLISLFGIIREVLLGLFNEIIKPFLGVIGPALLALITTPFAKIGNVLVDFWAKIAPKEDGTGGLGEYFANLREKIVAFWESAKELEGVKKLQEAWGNFKTTIKGIWDTALSKVQTGFAELKKNFKLPEGQFFLDLISNISTKLADFWTWMSGKATVVSDFFSPMFDWLVGLPVKIQDFWNSIGGFKGVQSYFKPITDWFAGVGDTIGNFWSSLWGKKGEEGAEDVPGLFSPIIDWFDKLKQKFDAFIQEASKFTNIKDLFDWLVELVRGKVKNLWDTLWGVNEAGEGEEAVDGNLSLFERLKKAIDDFLGELNPLKALQDFFTNFWSTLFGGGEDKENGEPKKGVFAQFKEDALAFIDSVEPLKAVKDYVLSIFNEDLITSIQDVGAAIKEFFTNLFGAQEEGKEKLPFVDRFMQAAEGLKTKLAEIFGGKGAGLAKVLAGGKIVTTLLALAGILTKLNKNQNGEGIAGAIFGSSKHGFSLPGIVSIITAAAAALLLFGDNSEKAGEKSKTAGDILTNVWTTIQNLFGNITSWFSSVDPLGFIFGALFGTKDENGETQTKGIITYLEEKITTIFDSVSKFFTDFINEDKFGVGNALLLLGGGALGFGIFNIFKGIASLFTTLFGIIKGGIPLLGDISNALEAYTTNVRADTLLTIAHAIGVFALSLIGLSLIPTDRLYGVVGAVIALMGGIALLMGLYAKFFTKGSTVKELSKEVPIVGTVVNNLVDSLAAAFKKAATFAGLGLIFIGMAAAFAVLTGAILKFSKMDPLAAIGGLSVMLTILATIGVLIKTLTKDMTGGKGLGVAAALIGLGVAMMFLAGAMATLSNKGNFMGFLGVVMALMLTAQIIEKFADIFNGGTKMYGIGKGIFYLALAVAALGLASRMFKGDDKSWSAMAEAITSLWAVMGGMYAFIWALEKLEPKNLENISKAFKDFGTGITALVVGLILLGTFSQVAMNGIVPFAIALGAMAVAMLLFKALKVDETFEKISGSIMNFAKASLMLAAAIPLLGIAFTILGQVIVSHIGEFITGAVLGTVMLVGLIAALGAVSAPAAGPILAVGGAILMIASAISLLIAVIRGDDVTGVIEGVLGFIPSLLGGAFGGLIDILFGAGKALKDFGGVAKSVFSELTTEAPKYESASERYKKILDGIGFVSEEVKKSLISQVEGLKELDGSNYTIGIKNIVGYIDGLNLDEKQKNRLIKETIAAAEDQQREEYTLKVYNIKTELSDRGVDPKVADKVFDLLQEAFDATPTSIRAIINNVHAAIEENPDISIEDKQEIIDAFDTAAAAEIEYQTEVKKLKTYLSENTNLTVENINKIQKKLDSLTERKQFKATLGKVMAEVDKVEPKNRAKLRGLIREALKQKVAMTTALGTVNATVDKIVVDPSKAEDIKTKINDGLEEISALIASGDENGAVGKLESIKAYIDSIDDVILPDGQKEVLKRKVDEAFDSIKSYNFAIGELYLTIDELKPKQQEAFRKLMDELLNSDDLDAAKIEELWVECRKLGMTDEQITGLLDQLGITLDAEMSREIELHNIHAVLDEKGIEGETREQIETALEELREQLETDPNGTDYEIKKKAAIDLLVENGITPERAQALVEEYLGEAEDLQTGKISMLSALVNGATFATDAERKAFQTEVENLFGLYGTDLKTAIENFKNNIINNSSLKPEEASLIAQNAEGIVAPLTEGVKKGYEDQLRYLEKIRRSEYLGSYVVDTETGSYVNRGSSVADLMAKFFKGHDATEVTEEELFAFEEELRSLVESGKATVEDIISSFSETGLTDEEIFNIFFPFGEYRGVIPSEILDEFLKPYINALLTGRDEMYRNEVSRYGKLDWASLLTPVGEDSPGMYYNTEGIAAQGRVLAEDIDRDLEAFTDDIKAYRQSLDSTIKDSDPITFEQIYAYFFDEESGSGGITQYQNLPFAQMLMYIHDLIESGEITLEEAAQQLDRTLYKTGTGLTEATQKTNEELTAAYNELSDGQKLRVKALKDLFDPSGQYATDIDFYGYLQSMFKGAGMGRTEGLDLDELLENPDLNIKEAFIQKLTEMMENEQITSEELAALYHQFPDLRQLVKDYIAEREGTEEQIDLPEGFQENLDKEIEALKEKYKEAIEKATSNDEGTQAEGIDILGSMIKNNEISRNEAAAWGKELLPDDVVNTIISSVQEQLGGSVDGMDASNVGASIFDLFSNNGVDVSGEGISQADDFVAGLIEELGQKAGEGKEAGASFMDSVLQGSADAGGIASPSTKMRTQGVWLMIGLRQGIKSNKSGPVSAAKEVMTACIDAIKAMVSQFNTQGAAAGTAFGTGIGSKQFWAKVAGMGLATQAKEGAASMDGAMERAGENFADGFIKGIGAKVHEAYQAGVALGMAAAQGEADATKTESPSKVAMQLGRYFGEGYVIGLGQFSKQAGKAGGDLAESAIDSFGNPLSTIQSLLDSDMDLDPTIRPVMDLSDIQNGVRTINGMMPDTKMGLNFISSSMSKVKTTNTDVVNAITGLSKQLSEMPSGDTYTVNGITYDDGSNITSAIRSLVHEAKIERRR